MKFVNVITGAEVDHLANLNHVKRVFGFNALGADLASTDNVVLGKKLKPEKTYYCIRFDYEKRGMTMVWGKSKDRDVALERVRKLIGPAPRIKCDGVVV